MTHQPIDAGLLLKALNDLLSGNGSGDYGYGVKYSVAFITEKIASGALDATPPGDCVEALREAVELIDGIIVMMPPEMRENVQKISDSWTSIIASAVLDPHLAALSNARPAQGWIKFNEQHPDHEQQCRYRLFDGRVFSGKFESQECAFICAHIGRHRYDMVLEWQPVAPPAPQADKK